MRFPFSNQLPLETFASEYWEKRPLILPKAFREFDFPIRRSDLFDLACNSEFDSRLIREDVEFNSWELYEGPFDSKELDDLLELSHWTLLIQNTEWMFDSMHELLEQFRFIPNWRLDDVQLSFATAQGSAGPHVDSYDVFLVQISGEKNWKIESSPIVEDRAMMEDQEIQVLEEFHPDQEYIVKPGDVLYLPPNIPHWGIAKGECITASIGFKVPEGRIFGATFLQMANRLKWKPEGAKPLDESEMVDPGRIGDAQLDWFQSELRLLTEDRNYLERIFCKAITEPVRERWPVGIYPVPSPDEIRIQLRKGGNLRRLTPGCMVYREIDDKIHVYVFGVETSLKSDLKPFAQLLTGSKILNFESLKPYLGVQDVVKLLQMMIEIGALIESESE
ncbi:MAG: hypothetical protein OXE92_05755 [Bacteroidetes bacterium]|nr:hypothetical protein [Bacteroidota bacterium]MCY4205214.1 hypothetical protein [Bacteroidota bacterium]